ncbi:carboxypeptidase S [Thozetella sp. PMI_491]|nr:carboxypeptidase S [Thozetella sp. PMI_491]
MDAFLASDKFRNESIARLSGAVQIPTQSYDDMGPIGEDERWDAMYKFAEYLERIFPAIHSTLQAEKINTHGLLYTWQGSDPSLKPILLMAHQDVVPVAESTIDQWTHPPFSGHYDGEKIWGRGAGDCKNVLIGLMEAVELLIQAEFAPKRTVIVSLGFDEEISGMEGAGHLAPAILERYGKDGIAAIVDEGAGIAEFYGGIMALPAVGEKGYVDVEIIVRMPGGHSSVPPLHTGIGVMAELITAIEANPYRPHIHTENPFLGTMTCAAVHSPEFPADLKKLLEQRKPSEGDKPDELAEAAAQLGDIIKYMFTTSVAVDVISGGVKVNALPERTSLLVNHRVNVGDHTSDVLEKMTKIASAAATKYNLTLHAFDGEPESPASITLVARDVLEPAPVTPTNVDSTTPYAILSGTTRAVYGTKLFISPGFGPGNTDTKFYWDLTKHIFRWDPGWDPEHRDLPEGAHTINEWVGVKAHTNGVKWYSLFLRNMDEALLE